MEEHHFQDDEKVPVKSRTLRNGEWTLLKDVYHATYTLRAPLVVSNGYPYKPLDLGRNEIRLLRKSNESGTDTQVNYTLTHVSLDSQPKYEALSYTWCDETGNDGLEVVINVDGHPLRVTKNLGAALVQLFTDKHELILWVDALCICQANVLERNEQVGKMKTVYQEAIGVITWLGAEYEESSNAFKLLRSFHRDGIKETVYGGTEPAKPEWPAIDSVVEDTHAVVKLFNREYWQRSWVVQEVALAKRLAIHCGRDSMPWEDLEEVLMALRKEDVLLTNAFLSTTVGHLMWHIVSNGPNQIVRKGQNDEEELNTLSKALIRHRRKKATDPRDKIYSLFGIISIDIQARVPVDYSLEPRIVFQKVATYIVIEEKDLSILAENKAPSPSKELPSWVPNWANTNVADKIRLDRFNYPKIGFQASGPGCVAEGYSISNDLLRVKGICIGIVTAVGPVMPDFHEEEFNFEPVFDTLYEWWLIFHSIGRRDIIGRGSFLDIVNHGYFYDPILGQGPEIAKKYEDMALRDVKIAFSTYKQWDQTILPILKDLEHPVTDLEKRSAEVNIWNLAPVCRRRKFIVVDGKTCGIGPQGVEAGDQVVVVLGCRVPIIFRNRKREDDGGYINLGDASLSDYMNGEALKDVENGTRKFESFELH